MSVLLGMVVWCTIFSLLHFILPITTAFTPSAILVVHELSSITERGDRRIATTDRHTPLTQRWMTDKSDDDFNPNNSIVIEDTNTNKGKRTIVAPEEAFDGQIDEEQQASSEIISNDVGFNDANDELTNGREFLLVDESQQVEDEVYMKIAIDLANEEYVLLDRTITHLTRIDAVVANAVQHPLFQIPPLEPFW